MRSLLSFVVALALTALTVGPATAGTDVRPLSRSSASLADLRIVFVAMDRAADGRLGGLQQIFTADGGGGNLRQITSPRDGNFYDWAEWAFNGTKIVYTQRAGELPGGEEAIWMMNPDGTGRVKLTSNPWRNAQPKVSPDGRWLVFTSIWGESPELAIYKIELATLQVQNLTARGGGTFAFESDPSFSADGKSIVFAQSGGRNKEMRTVPTQIWSMAADGTGGRPITSDRYYNTDPARSPDGRHVAISSYRGAGVPRHAWPPQSADDIFLQDWQLVIRDLETGVERTLTRGQRCLGVETVCAADQGPAWVPKWSPDGQRIGYLTVRGRDQTGIAIVDADGKGARPLVELRGRAITWWDWTDGRRTAADSAATAIGSAVPKARLLYSAAVYGELARGAEPPRGTLFSATPDRWIVTAIDPALSGIAPTKARWTPDRRHIVFTSRVPVDRATPKFTPAPPPGRDRRTHYTFADLAVLADNLEAPRASGDVAEEQVFMMNADGSDVRQLTTPWTEDYMDAIPSGDARGNTDPDVSPDGRYVVFTNLSTLTQESFLLRLDLHTGEVINLTSMTAGAVPVADANPRYSPSGSQIAFSSSSGGGSQIYVMEADGTEVKQVTDDDWANLGPAWSPDGRTLVYSTYRGRSSIEDLEELAAARTLPLTDWSAVTVEVDGGNAAIVVGGDRLVLRPQWTPDGSSIAFISLGPSNQPDIYVVARDGAGLRPLQTTILSKELFFDWR